MQIENLHAYYGAVEALKGVDIEVHDGHICSIIGANGAGKTTLLKSISGVLRKTGSIRWNGREIGGCSPIRVARLGIVHVPEGRLVFPGLTVQQNLEVGAVTWHGMFGRQSLQQDMDMVFELFPRLKERRKQGAWSLSGGEQQMLAIGRGLMARPRLLMLDEPSMGLAPVIVDELFKKIVEINKMGLPILLIEQNAKLALKVSRYAYILEQGTVRAHAESQEILKDSTLVEAYLGKFAHRSVKGVTSKPDERQAATPD